MKIILVRHGEAEDPASAKSDQSRVLTEKGIRDIQKIGKFILDSPLKVNQVYYSPYIRTRLTAEILAEEIAFSGSPISSDDLAVGAGCSNILSCLVKLTNSDTVLLVGHNPDIAIFAAELLGNGCLVENLVFSPGTSIAINVARERFAHGQIIWTISPDLLAGE